MRRWSRVAVFLLCASNPSLATADAYSDFRIPDHSWRSTRARLYGSLGQAELSNSALQDANRAALGGLMVGSTWDRDSDRWRHQSALDLRVSGSASHDERRVHRRVNQYLSSVLEDSNEDEQRRSIWNESLDGSTSFRAHPWERPWGVELSLGGRAGFEQRRVSQEAQSRFVDTVYSYSYRILQDTDERTEQYRLTYSLAVGHGRVRDASVVYQVRLLIDRLRTDGELQREPTTQDLERLAGIFYLSPDYSVVHDQAGKWFWRDIEQVLVGEGLIESTGLDAYALQHALEPVVVSGGRIKHLVGWWVAPSIGQVHEKHVVHYKARRRSSVSFGDTLTSQYDQESSLWRQLDRDYTQYGYKAEWHRPWGARTQFDVQSSAAFAERSTLSDGVYSTSASVEHLIDERWFVWADANHQRQAIVPYSSNYWFAGGSAGIRHYLEDRWNIELRMDHGQSRSSGTFRRSTGLTLAFQYDRGALDAPGLIEPVRPLD